MILGGPVLLDSISDFDAITDFDNLGTVSATSGTYDFANKLDLGGKQPLRLIRHFVTQGFYPSDLFDDRTANVDTWTDFDGAKATDVNAKLLVSTTDSDPATSVSATYAQSGTTIIITKSGHGYSVGSNVEITFSTGTAVTGNYEIITVPTSSTFTVTASTSATTSGNCTYSAQFTKFNTFANGTFIGRGFRFRCEMISDDPAQSIEIDQLGYSAELERRTETVNTLIASGTSSKAVTFTNSFFTGSTGTGVSAGSALPNIGITIENAQSGDFFALSSISGTGFTLSLIHI